MEQRKAKPVSPKFGFDLITAYRGARVHIDRLNSYIGDCEDIISDCEHYLELFPLNATEQIRVTGVLREAMRNKRNAQDERQLTTSALREINNTHSCDALSFDQHYARVTGTRGYNHKAVTLEQCLEVRPPKPKKKKKRHDK